MSANTESLADLDDEQFRHRIRDFFNAHHPGRRPKDADARLAWQRQWLATLFDAGLAGPSWPREFGGMALPFNKQVIYNEEYARARLPGPLGNGVNIASATIIQHGTREQQDRWLAPMLRGDQVWCQGSSEPDAGSDLPALRTRARRDGDGYVVTGQKVWTSWAFYADVIYALVRTGTQESRQHGLTYLVIDAHSPGVTIRPLRDITGASHFAEVFFDEARVPVSNRIGAENGGWALVRSALGHERSAYALTQAWYYRRVLTELVDLMRERDATSDPLVRNRLVEFEIRVRIMQYNAMRTIEDITTRGEPGASSSVSRLVVAAFEQELHEFALDVLGPEGLLLDGPDVVQRGRWVYGFLRTRASTIGTGTAEIQRNTLAQQVLKLPHDVGMPR